jgi:excisionase family DNA binding protein
MSTQFNSIPDEKLSVVQVAAEIRCHPNTVWNQIKKGRLVAVRFGPRLVRVRRSDLERFLSSYHSENLSGWFELHDRTVS